MNKTRSGFDAEEIVEEFKAMCPWAAGNIVGHQELGEGEMLFHIRDDSVISYDYITKTFRAAKSYEEYTSMRCPDDETRWQKEFAYRLYRTMTYKGFTQAELSYATGMSQSSISTYLTGKSTPSIISLIKMARAMGCTGSELVKLICY